jgi:hypothetical protein
MKINLRAKLFESPFAIALISITTGIAIFMAIQQLENHAFGAWLYFIPIGVFALILELRKPWGISIENDHARISWLFGVISKDFHLSSIELGARAFLWPAICLKFTDGSSLKIRKNGYNGIENLDMKSPNSKSA